LLVLAVLLAGANIQAHGCRVKARRQPIACDAVGGLDAAGGSRTIGREKDGMAVAPLVCCICRFGSIGMRRRRRGAPARAGLKPERGAGSAVAAERSGAALI